MSDQGAAKAPQNKLLAYLQLVRIPNVFTAIADIVAGFLLVHASLTPLAAFLFLILSSCLLYMAGMVLNDVYDVEVDRVERPSRPLPSGRISLNHARWIGYGMLLLGVATAGIAGVPALGGAFFGWRPFVVASLLASCIVLYDAALKKTPAGPFMMGFCRFFNVLLGASTASVAGSEIFKLGYSDAQLTVAAGIGIYIVGVTMFARTEARESNRSALTTALVVIVFGIVILAVFPSQLDFALLRDIGKTNVPFFGEFYWLMLLGLLAITIVRRCIMAIIQPTPVQVQMAVKHSILSLITLNAAVALQMGGPPFALGVFALVLPAMLLGKWVYST